MIPYLCYFSIATTVTADAVDARAVIASTLHSTHADLISKLNFALIHPRLDQDGVVPVESFPDLLCPQVPDHRAARVNNLIIWLQRCSLEQFRRFIALLRETAGEGGDAHEELADFLEGEFKKFYNNYEPPGTKCNTYYT